MAIRSQEEEKKSDDSKDNGGSALLFLFVLVGILLAAGYFLTDKTIEGTNTSKYTFSERLASGDIYILSVITLLIVIIACFILGKITRAQDKKTNEQQFLRKVASQIENTNGFLSLEELRERNAKIIPPDEELNIRTACVIFDNHIHIQWEKLKLLPAGHIIIYRRTGGFVTDDLSETENGIIVEHKPNNVFVFEDREDDKTVRGVTYSYTIHYKLDNDERNTRYSFARLSGMIPIETVEREPEKSVVEIHAENKNEKLKIDEINRKADEILKTRDKDDEVKDLKQSEIYIGEAVAQFGREYKEKNPKATRKEIDEQARIFERDLRERLDVLES